MRCNGELYVSGSTEEYTTPEWSYVVRAQCNAGPPLYDCGFDEVVDELVDLSHAAWGLTNTDMEALQARHLKHSKGESE